MLKVKILFVLEYLEGTVAHHKRTMKLFLQECNFEIWIICREKMKSALKGGRKS